MLANNIASESAETNMFVSPIERQPFRGDRIIAAAIRNGQDNVVTVNVAIARYGDLAPVCRSEQRVRKKKRGVIFGVEGGGGSVTQGTMSTGSCDSHPELPQAVLRRLRWSPASPATKSCLQTPPGRGCHLFCRRRMGGTRFCRLEARSQHVQVY